MSTSMYRRSPGERRPGGRALELHLHGGAYGGQMVARNDGRVVFVQGGIPGETVRAQLTVEKKTFAEARATHIVVPASGRTVPPCPYFGENGHARGAVPGVNGLPGERVACGGCQYQHLDYETQLALKRDIVADLMHRQARLPDLEVLPAIASPSPWRYRNRARWMIDDAGRPCYHQASSERLLAVHECHIIQPILAGVLSALDDEAWRLPLRTLVSEITVRTATAWDAENADEPARPSVLLVLHPRPGARRRDLRLLANDLGAGLPGLDGVAATGAEARSTSTTALWGDGSFDARFAGYRFRLSPLTFFQVNEPAAEALIELVLERLGPLDGKSVVDVYSGAGAFALPIAARAERVLAVENDPTAIDDANRTVRANDLANVHVIPGDAESELDGLPPHAVDAAVLDPPRAGISAEVIDELARIDVPRVVYVSCDPATLARDLRRFADKGYGVSSVQPIDLFPQTFHIESVAVLDRA